MARTRTPAKPPAPTTDDTHAPMDTHEDAARDDAPARLPVMAALEYEGLDYDDAPAPARTPPEAQPAPEASAPALGNTTDTLAPVLDAPTTPAGYLARVQHGQYRPFGALNLDPLNPRTISPEMLDRLMGSIREFGFVEPVVVRPEDGLVVGGHQRMEALWRLMLGEGKSPTEIAATLVPVAILPPGVSDAHTRALNVGLNRISGSWDYEKLNVILSELRADVDALDFAGFSLPEVDDIAASLASIHHSAAVTGAAAGAAGFAAFGGGGAGGAGRGGFGALDGTAGEQPAEGTAGDTTDGTTAGSQGGAEGDAPEGGTGTSTGTDAGADGATTRHPGGKGAPDPLDPYTMALDDAGPSERDGRRYRRFSLPYPVLPPESVAPSAEALHGWVVALGYALADAGRPIDGHAGVEPPEGAPHPPWSVVRHALAALSAELGVPVPTGTCDDAGEGPGGYDDVGAETGDSSEA